MFGYKDTVDTAWIDTADIVWHELGFYTDIGTVVIIGSGVAPEMYWIVVPGVFDYGYKDTAGVEWHDQTEVIWAPIGIYALPGAVTIGIGAVADLKHSIIPFVSTINIESDYWTWEQISSRVFNIELKTISVICFVDDLGGDDG